MLKQDHQKTILMLLFPEKEREMMRDKGPHRVLKVATAYFARSSSKLYFARVIPSIQTVLLSIGALEFKNLQYTFKNLLQPIYKMQGTFTNI